MELKAVADMHLWYIIDDDPHLICSMANVHAVVTFLFVFMLEWMGENMLSGF